MPLAQGSQSNDFEDAFATFDRETRPNLRKATEGFGTAFTGRGPSINQALAALPPLLDDLRPVMATLNDPSTDLRGLRPQPGRGDRAGGAGGPPGRGRWRATAPTRSRR